MKNFTSHLNDKFSRLFSDCLDACRRRGVIMQPFSGIRSPVQQAKLYRQSRSLGEIKKAITYLRSKGAPFLAHCIEIAGPQYGRWATNSLPGCSWHQWGEAIDAFWLADGSAVWDVNMIIDGVNGYRVYAEEAERLNLTSMRSINDWVHVQYRPGSVGLTYSFPEIDAEMKRLYEYDGN